MRKEAQDYYQAKLKKLQDTDLRVFVRPPLPARGEIHNVHLIGVCGTAMGSLAGLLATAGYKVSGSDEGCYPPMDKIIEELRIDFKEGYTAEHVKGADLVIVGNASKPTNPEAQYVREDKRPSLSLPEATREFFIQDKRSLVVAGTHGKTTTTGMLAHVFESSGKDPSYIVGGVMQNYSHSFRLGHGEHFIIEGDEYDTSYFDKSPKFLHYAPTSAIITSLEFDHIDIYESMDDYRNAFKFLVQEIPAEGNLFLWGDSPELKDIAPLASCTHSFYGLDKGNDITALDVQHLKDGQEFDLIVRGERVGKIFLPMHGKHNLLNALAVCGLSLAEGISIERLKEGLSTWKGMKRRQEIVGEARGITIIDDFAHHPTAVEETLKSIQEQFPGRRIVAFFEPRSNTSRRKIFEEAYGKAFDLADEVFLSIPPFRHNDKKEDFIDADKLTQAIFLRGPKAHFFNNADELLAAAMPTLQEEDVVLIMSNGSFDGIHHKLLDSLK